MVAVVAEQPGKDQGGLSTAWQCAIAALVAAAIAFLGWLWQRRPAS